MQYGRMVRSGAVPDPTFKGDDEWLQEMMMLAGEAMRKWDPEKGAYSTYVVACLRLGIRNSLEKDARGGVTADHGVPVFALSIEDQRPGVQPDEEAEDDGTFNAVLAYGGVVERDRRPEGAPEGLGDPAEEAERMQGQARLVAALALLPMEDREALIATQVETQKEYAARKGLPRTTVQSYVERARLRIRHFLESAVN